MVAEAMNTARYTVGSIFCKFKVKAFARVFGDGRNRTLSMVATRLLRRQVVENTQVTLNDLQPDLVAAV